MICPKCSFEQADGKKECAKRGGADPSGCAMEKLLQLPLLCDRRSEFPGAMNDRYDLNILVLTYDPIDDSVVTVYDFSQLRVIQFGHHATAKGHIFEFASRPD